MLCIKEMMNKHEDNKTKNTKRAISDLPGSFRTLQSLLVTDQMPIGQKIVHLKSPHIFGQGLSYNVIRLFVQLDYFY